MHTPPIAQFLDIATYFPQEEDIEREDQKRLAHQPVQYIVFYKLYKELEASFWTDEDIDKDAERDCLDRNKATSAQIRLFDYTQGHFAAADFVVGDIISDKLMKRIKNTDVRIVLQYNGMMENIHSIVYAKVIEKAVKNKREREKIFEFASKVPTVQRKIDWIKKWVGWENDIHDLDKDTIMSLFNLVDQNNRILSALHPNEDINQYKSDHLLDLERKLGERIPQLDRLLVALAIMEGVFFSGSFAVVFWFAKMGMFPGASRANQLIKNDEGKHVETGALIHRLLIKHKEPQSIVYEMIKEAVEIENDFMKDAMPPDDTEGMIGMNSKLMLKYIKFSADWVLDLFGYEKLYGIKFSETFDFMIKQSISDTFTDFFKSEETNYKIHGTNETAEDKQSVFDDNLEEI
jgi:ribonucleoside-diphosphate reductase subunit M2